MSTAFKDGVHNYARQLSIKHFRPLMLYTLKTFSAESRALHNISRVPSCFIIYKSMGAFNAVIFSGNFVFNKEWENENSSINLLS